MNVILFLKNVWAIRRLILLVIAFTVPTFLLVDGSVEFRCAYVMVVMAITWLTEALPITTTALMPIFLLPMLGVQHGKVVCRNYVNDTSMLFLGGLIVAVAMEEVMLHKRIALAITMLFGSRTNTLMLGLMIPTWFLSMWISNTAATSMMLPIIIAVTEQMEKVESNDPVAENGHDVHLKNMAKDASPDDVQISMEDKEKSKKNDLNNIAKAFTLCVAYSANAGGIATLTGTPPNLVLQGQADKQFQAFGAPDSGITYAKWMGFGLPLSFLMLFITWIWLQIYFLGFGMFKKTDEARKEAISFVVKNEYKKLGKMKFGEIIVLVLFTILAILWIVRDLPGVGGWANGFLDDEGKKTTRDSTAAILVAVLLFIVPKEVPNLFCCYKATSDTGEPRPIRYKPILTWEVAEKKVAWGVIFLLGGGFALADACTKSGLSKLVGCELRVFQNMEPWVMNLVLCLIVAGATEITSNTATASLLMPIMFELGLTIGVNPLYLMVSAAVACSFAFMLPVATPPNAIVFATKRVRIIDMARVGIIMNVVAILVLTLAVNTWGAAIFDLKTVPSIFLNGTQRDSCNTNIVNTNTTAMPAVTSILNISTTVI